MPALGACSSGNDVSVTALSGAEPDAPVQKLGDLVAQQGSWIYFVNGMVSSVADYSFGAAVEGALCRMKADNRTVKDIVIPQTIISFEIVGGWIYYLTPLAPASANSSDTRTMACKIRVDGTGYTQLKEISDFSYYNNTGEYILYSQNGKLYKSDIDFNNKTMLLDKEVYTTYQTDGRIYYSLAIKYSDGTVSTQGLYYMDMDGNNKTTVSGGVSAVMINVTGGRIYYYDNDSQTIRYTSADKYDPKVLIYTQFEKATMSNDNSELILTNSSANKGVFIYDIAAKTTTQISGDGADKALDNGDSVIYINKDVGDIYYIAPKDKSYAPKAISRHVADSSVGSPANILNGYLYYINKDDYNYLYRTNISTGIDEYIAIIPPG